MITEDANDGIALDDITIDDVFSGEGSDDILGDGLDLPEDEVEDELEPDDGLEDILDGDEEDGDEEEEEDEEEDQEDEDEDDPDESDDGDNEDSTDNSVVGEILESLGYEPSDEYEDTPEGLTAMTKDIASQMADDRIDEVLENFPLVKQHLEYVLQGGESQNFMQAHDPRADYSAFELNENDTAAQRAILSNYFELKGHDKAFTNELLEDYEDSGKLFKKAAAAKEALGSYQQSQRDEMYEKQRASQVQAQKEQQEFWNGVSDTIHNANEFAGIKIPEKDKSKFFNYISQSVDNEGRTQRDVDHSEAEMDVKLAIDYLMYKGFDLGGLVNSRAKTKSVQSLREKISGRQESVKSAKRAKRRSKNVNMDDLDLSL